MALIEVYDLDQSAASKLANLSTRAFVSTGNNIVIAGFMLGSTAAMTGSSCAASVPASRQQDTRALANPTLEMRDGNGCPLYE